MRTREFTVREVAAPLVRRGYVSFVKIRPERQRRTWICDECFELVTPARQIRHAMDHS